MITILLSSCSLYAGECRVAEIDPAAQSWEECRSRGAVIIKALSHTIGDNGWTPVWISCSLANGTGLQIVAPRPARS